MMKLFDINQYHLNTTDFILKKLFLIVNFNESFMYYSQVLYMIGKNLYHKIFSWSSEFLFFINLFIRLCPVKIKSKKKLFGKIYFCKNKLFELLCLFIGIKIDHDYFARICQFWPENLF